MRSLLKPLLFGALLAAPLAGTAQENDAVQRQGVSILSGAGFDVISIRVTETGEHQFFAADTDFGRVLILDGTGAVVMDHRVEKWDVFSDEAMHALDNGTLEPLPVRDDTAAG